MWSMVIARSRLEDGHTSTDNALIHQMIKQCSKHYDKIEATQATINEEEEKLL